MRKVLRGLLVACLLAALPFAFTACKDDGGAAAEGQLPDLKMGDSWVWSYVMQGQAYTLTEEVIGEERVEGRDCWVSDMAFDPLLTFPQAEGVSTITGMTYWGDKATVFYEVKSEMAGTYDGEGFTMTMISDYTSWESLFPLEVGKELETEQTTTQYVGDNQAGEPVVTTMRFVVEGQENVTVSAGTFSCWKITLYDGEDNIVQVSWWSMEVKSAVKAEDSRGNVAMELLSYSVS